ncbi:MAG: hypothetical protein Q8R97_00940, partial [Brevundimonas sp.]|nr:hypothetical protein [Brevundimonas sp.]
PEWFIPVHGEYRHLVAHAKLARQMGIAQDKVWVCEDGHQLELTDDGLKAVGKVPAGYLYVDGIIGDVGQGVLRDRKVHAEEGVVVVIVTVDVETGAVLNRPEIVTRGWIYEKEAEGLLAECANEVEKAVAEVKDTSDIEAIQRAARKAAGRFVNRETKRKPMIVPVVLEA